jgi:phenylpyruvate tautomerase PptA (4-oxalocrotonate tautomerase family)
VPYYQFTVPTGGATLQHKAEIAAAMTRVHAEVTGAPGIYVHCSFVEVPAGSIFVAGEPVNGPRMVGTIRVGRSTEVRAKLIHALADAWCEITANAMSCIGCARKTLSWRWSAMCSSALLSGLSIGPDPR